MRTKKIEDCGLAVPQSSMARCVSIGASDVHNIASIETEVKEKFTPKKEQVKQLTSDYYVLGSADSRFVNRIVRVSQCGDLLKWGITADGKASLIHANFCKDLMCPMCNWRRSLKMFGEVSACMDILESKYAFLFATFTIRNCIDDDLKNTCSLLQKAFNRLMRLQLMENTIKGYFWALEITYNAKEDTYHPHLHCIFAVDESYFNTHSTWISQKKWSELWGNALKVDYTPVVYIKRLTGDIKKSVAEVAKYSVKGSDYLGRPHVLKAMFDALQHRKKCAFGGVFADARKGIGLDKDINDDDLVNTDPLHIRDDVFVAFVSSSWNGERYHSTYNTLTFGKEWE